MELNRKERRKGKEGEGGRGREGEERNGKEKKQLYLATSTASLKQKMYGWGVASPWGMVVCFGSVSVADFMHAGRHLLREGRHGHLPELS
eukprot:scaffold190495_cov15-Tisochrysis_lutea.AAC.2